MSDLLDNNSSGKQAKKNTAKVFMSGSSQAVRIPKAFRFDVDEVAIAKNDAGQLVLSATETVLKETAVEKTALEESILKKTALKKMMPDATVSKNIAPKPTDNNGWGNFFEKLAQTDVPDDFMSDRELNSRTQDKFADLYD